MVRRSRQRRRRSWFRTRSEPRRRTYSRRERRRFWFRLLSLAVGLIVGLVVAEFVLRIGNIRPERYQQPRWLAQTQNGFEDLGNSGGGRIKRPSPYKSDGVQMGEYVPGAVFKHAFSSNPRGYFDEDNGVLVKINSQGLRGPEISQSKPSGVFRILGLGDSFTLGPGVRDEHTFLRRLESSLNDVPPATSNSAAAPRKFEVLNAGVEGYNTRDEVLYLERRWLAFSPDVVVISFYLNDAFADGAIDNKGALSGGWYFTADGLARHSFLFDYGQHAFRAWMARHELQTAYSQPWFTHPAAFLNSPAGQSSDWPGCRAALHRAAELRKARGFHLMVMIFPEFYQLDGDYPFAAVHQLVKDACREEGLPVLDLLSVYGGQEDQSLWVHPSDHHPNERAHAQAADALREFLISEKFFSGPASGGAAVSAQGNR